MSRRGNFGSPAHAARKKKAAAREEKAAAREEQKKTAATKIQARGRGLVARSAKPTAAAQGGGTRGTSTLSSLARAPPMKGQTIQNGTGQSDAPAPPVKGQTIQNGTGQSDDSAVEVVEDTFELVKTLDKSVEELEKQNDKYGEIMLEKDRELQLANSRISELEAAAAAAATATGNVEGQLATARGELVGLKTKLSTTAADLKLEQAAKQAACTRNDRQQNLNQELGASCLEKTEEIKTLTTDLRTAEALVAGKRQEINELTGSKTVAAETQEALTEELEALKIATGDLQRKKNELETDKKNCNDKLKIMKSQKTEVNTKLETLIRGIETHMVDSKKNFMDQLQQQPVTKSRTLFGTKKKKPMKFDKAWFTYKRIMKPNNVRKMVAAFGKSVRKKRKK